MFNNLTEEDVSFILLCLFILFVAITYFIDYKKRKVLQEKVLKRTLYHLEKCTEYSNEYFIEFIVEDVVEEIIKRRVKDIKTIDAIINRAIDNWYDGYD